MHWYLKDAKLKISAIQNFPGIAFLTWVQYLCGRQSITVSRSQVITNLGKFHRILNKTFLFLASSSNFPEPRSYSQLYWSGLFWHFGFHTKMHTASLSRFVILSRNFQKRVLHIHRSHTALSFSYIFNKAHFWSRPRKPTSFTSSDIGYFCI